jgi:Flp pilus assembly protein TadG
MTMGTHIDRAAKELLAMIAMLKRRLRGAGGAQAAVEFAFAVPIVLVMLVLGIQFAIIGAAALALGQVNYQGARYAAVNTAADQTAVKNYMLAVASPTISANSGSYLTATLSPAPPCAFGSTVTVSVTYDVNHLLALPNPFLKIPPLFPGISFPTTLTNSETAFCEGSTN